MTKPTYAFADDVPENDRKVLEQKRDEILSALMYQNIYWQLVKDSKGRNHYRAVQCSDKSVVLCQVVIEDIKNLRDQELKNRIIGGDFLEREIR